MERCLEAEGTTFGTRLSEETQEYSQAKTTMKRQTRAPMKFKPPTKAVKKSPKMRIETERSMDLTWPRRSTVKVTTMSPTSSATPPTMTEAPSAVFDKPKICSNQIPTLNNNKIYYIFCRKSRERKRYGRSTWTKGCGPRRRGRGPKR